MRTRRFAQEISARNGQAYRHYRQCRAVGWNVPEASDPIVMRNARIIREIEDVNERLPLM